MQQTENYQLSLWNKEDRILMGIFRKEDASVNAAAASSPPQEVMPPPENFAGTA